MSSITEKSKQAGMVSIMVTMILMIVLSLIVLGFAQIARRNQRNSLDRQLSTQAFYAAETGINDVRNLIKSKGIAPAKADCTNGGGAELAYYGGVGGLNSVIDATHNVSYTCIIVNPTPTALTINDVNTKSSVLPLNPVSGNIAKLTLSWYTKTGSTTPLTGGGCPASTAVGALKTTGNWTCGYGVFRFDLVPTAGAGLTAANLQNSTMTSFMIPTTAPGSATTGFSANGSKAGLAANCTNTKCTLTIDSGLGGSQYYFRAMSYYQDVSLEITGVDAAGNPVAFQGAQVVIDATGKAQDVLRRVQVHVPEAGTDTNQLSDYALQSTDSVCKRFVVMSNYFSSRAAADVPGMTGSGNPLCN